MARGLRWKFLILVLLLVIAGWLLYPSYRLYSMSPEERAALPEETEESLKDKALRLGLDLQGGMHLVLELDRSQLEADEVKDAMARGMEILRNRVDQFGVAEPVIQRQGDDRIIIQLPGLLDKERAVRLIGQTALLEFKLVKSENETVQMLERLDRSIARMLRPSAADTLDTLDVATFEPVLDRAPLYPQTTLGGVLFPVDDVEELKEMFGEMNADSLLPRDAEVAFGTETYAVGDGRRGQVLYVLNRRPEMTGATIKNAIMSVGLDPNAPNAPGVSLEFNRDGTRKFRRVTGANVGRQLAIVLDGKVRSAPVIQERIPSGRAQITGSFSDEQARDLAIILRAGALPAPVKIIEERTVGPSLGRDSIDQGVRAGLLGGILVVLSIVIYYRASGLLAALALILNLLFLFAALAGLRGTLTLPGIAGVVLTVGMAVDANVLVFERIREELRTGKTVSQAVRSGYARALTTILDANLTTLISAVVLFNFGTGPVKGFAITLMIGIIANIYTAVFVTRMFFDFVMSRRRLESLSI
ncbi:MAG: protein translocase subunit SecD [Candidatus Eisenbacteria bacterium]|nr:protein translocase subunit SecD [Candidatus Eisenbacteria bacterium]